MTGIADQAANAHLRHRELMTRCRGIAPAPTAVVHPCDPESLGGAVEAAGQGLIVPILVGPEGKIRSAAATAGLDISPFRLVATPHSHAAAAEAVALARRGEGRSAHEGQPAHR